MIRWGVIGLGKIAHRFIRSLEYSKLGFLYAVASRTPSKRDEYQNSSILVFDNYEELIAHPEIDAVYIALPHKDHFEYAKKCLIAHKPVLCEKPITLSVKQLEDLINRSQENQVLLMEALKTRFIPAIAKLHEVIDSIGPIKSIEASFDDESEYDEQSYLFDSVQGGAIYDVATYPLGFALDFMKEKPLKMTTVKRMKYGVDVYFRCVITYENSKVIVEGAKDRSKPHDALIVGERGTINVPTFNRPDHFTLTIDGIETTYEVPLVGDDMLGEIESFSDSLLRKDVENIRMSHNDSLEIMRLIERMKES